MIEVAPRNPQVPSHRVSRNPVGLISTCRVVVLGSTVVSFSTCSVARDTVCMGALRIRSFRSTSRRLEGARWAHSTAGSASCQTV
jgi:hypothetical protein